MLTKVLMIVIHISGNFQGTAVNTGFTGLQSICDQADMDKSCDRLGQYMQTLFFSIVNSYLYGANHVIKSHQ
jgi:hypothetical protein